VSLARIRTFAFSGIEAVPVEVQVQIAPGLPAFLKVWTIIPRPMLQALHAQGLQLRPVLIAGASQRRQPSAAG
jgi:hypothetical protein